MGIQLKKNAQIGKETRKNTNRWMIFGLHLKARKIHKDTMREFFPYFLLQMLLRRSTMRKISQTLTPIFR